MEYSLGYLKDCFACFFFAILLGLVYYYNIHLNKNLVMGLLLVGLIIDSLFTFFSHLHCESLQSIVLQKGL